MAVNDLQGRKEFSLKNVPGIVIDQGVGFIKAGFSGDDTPIAIFPTVVGRHKNPGIMMGDCKDFFVGDESVAKRGILRLSYPLTADGPKVPINWYFMEKLYHHTFCNELRITPEEHPILLTDLPVMDRKAYSKIGTLMFEEFSTLALQIANSSALSLFSAGELTGVALDIGYGSVRCVPVYEEFPISHAYEVLETRDMKPRIGGKLISDYLIKLYNQKCDKLGNGDQLVTLGDLCIGNDMKEKLCYVAYDFEKESEREESEICRSYELPDGRNVELGKELSAACEVLFDPMMVGYPLPGIHDLVGLTIERVEEGLRDLMYRNIVVTGGGSMHEGLVERLEKEMCTHYSNLRVSHGKKVKSKVFGSWKESYNKKIQKDQNHKVGITAQKDRPIGGWVGGSILTSLSTIESCWITKKEYDEAGIRIVKRKTIFSVPFRDKREQLFRYCLRGSAVKFDPDVGERIEFLIEKFVEGEDEGKKKICFVLQNVKLQYSLNLYMIIK